MAPHPSNFKLRDEMRLGPSEQYQRLCDRANGVDADSTPPSLAKWLDVLRKKAEADLKMKKEDRNEKPPGYVLRLLSEALGRYRFDSTAFIDTRKGRLMKREDHPADATNEQLVAFMLGVAISTGDWQRFRRCAEPKCYKFFFDYSTGRGRNPRTYCCVKHQKNHGARLRRGKE